MTETSLLLTDLYELNMMQAYQRAGMTETAVFEFFVRRLPSNRNFLVAAGLEQVVDFLQDARFTQAEVDWLAAHQGFSAEFLDSLLALRFTGDVDAMPEGTIFFADEPILRVTAPLPEAQLFETRIINLLHFQTVVASKASRMALAAGDIQLSDFGLRRAHGAEAGLLAARASYLSGFAGSATVLAAQRFGVPVSGTMAHSFVQAHESEALAFVHFAESRREGVVLLIDTYDTEAAARKVVALAPRLTQQGLKLKGVRLDSGDLAEHARRVRAILDIGGLEQVQIFASGGLDEWALQRFVAEAAPIDACGIGTSLSTSQDVPALDCAYKLQEYAGQAKRKRSEGKATWPGRKQVYRRYDSNGVMTGDTLTLEGDTVVGEPLLQPAMRAGKSLETAPSLADSRAHATAERQRLPVRLRDLKPAEPYVAEVSHALRSLTAKVDHDQRASAES
ncbi:nicotinate phosphoribosyltransferase [Pelagibius litoralis]|uniref:Nicotinate phosphoribosyltransferase n=1 Tax=Pelagibius litoralis TaxID=374515 RepID=A0A967F1R6_9PROT|nr:nicotinate phosphoribosyltransferase [Pelagibius litoralis]NIA71453.1 nicotinate phosphoribosyltransferase [Pelagibius litoralis]